MNYLVIEEDEKNMTITINKEQFMIMKESFEKYEKHLEGLKKRYYKSRDKILENRRCKYKIKEKKDMNNTSSNETLLN